MTGGAPSGRSGLARHLSGGGAESRRVGGRSPSPSKILGVARLVGDLLVWVMRMRGKVRDEV